MATADPRDAFHRGEPYERYVGRWSSVVARDFLAWLDLPRGLRWVDVGCGTGALTAAIAARCEPATLTGVEPSEGFAAKARARLDGIAQVFVGGAAALPLAAASVDVVVSGLVLNFIPDVPAGLREMRRVVAPGGTIAAYVWDYAGRMEIMRHFWDAAVELAPVATQLDEGVRFPLCQPVALAESFRNAGLTGIVSAPIEVATRFDDFDDYWQPFLGGQGPAPAYAMSLDDASRDRLRERIRARLPAAPDGSISLVARAWAIRSRSPREESPDNQHD